MLNFGILVGPFILAVVYPHVGSIAGILGAVGAFVCIYTLPTLTFLAQKKTEIDNPELMQALRTNNFTMSPPKPRKKRESLYTAENLDPDIVSGNVKMPRKPSAQFEMKLDQNEPMLTKDSPASGSNSEAELQKKKL